MLAIANFVLVFVVLGGILNAYRPSSITWLMAGLLMLLFMANTIYLSDIRTLKSGRIRRMFGYWLDAKEADLKAKAGKAEER
ncbi:MAG TPA: hypothetical protein VNS12_00810 [Pelagibacterium sp.]|nr:hypothetical protein [Pelagibacterium sp.]